MAQQSSDPYAGFSTPVKEAPTLREQATKTNIVQGQTSAARGQADLPYIAPTAAEQLERLRLQNEELQRQLDKAKRARRSRATTRLSSRRTSTRSRVSIARFRTSTLISSERLWTFRAVLRTRCKNILAATSARQDSLRFGKR